jgi:glyoxylase-like metal-dependent hydrolase (beta-lactamase superfamily II)
MSLALPRVRATGILDNSTASRKENVMRVDTLTVGMFQSNCFVVSCERTKEAVIIDAGDEGDRIAEHVAREKLNVKLIVITHAHIDHVAGLPALAAAVRAPVAMHRSELSLYENVGRQAMLFGLEAPRTVKVDRFLDDGEKVAFGGVTGQVIHTPGHSPGGISVEFRDETPPAIFVGDVLFRGSIGRTDLMGASERQMASTLRNVILELPDDMKVYSGHGPETTIGEERRLNPFLIDVEGWSG